MSGVAVVRSLVAAASGVTNTVPATRIMAGDLPLNTTLPAIAITSIDAVPRNGIRVNEGPRFWTERVQVTALAKDSASASGYATAKAIVQAALAACTSRRGTVNGVAVDSISPDSMGPDLASPDADLYSSSVDLIVRWSA